MVVGKGPSVNQLARRQRIEFEPDVSGFAAAPEDAILGKLNYYREGGSDKHLRDIKGILKVSGHTLDHDYLNEQAAQFGTFDLWQTLSSDYGRTQS
jgi:hypothetical protein